MKFQPWKYRGIWLVLLVIVIIVLLSAWSGAGYVLMVWLGWQVQTSASLFILLICAIITLLVYLIRMINRWIRNWYLRHPRRIEHYQQLLPFEQLGCLWLLNARTTKPEALEQIFSQSASLKQLVEAHLQRENQHYAQAWQALQQGSALSDLLAVEKIELLLAEQRNEEALNGLEQLAAQPESSFASSLNPAWSYYLQSLWSRLAVVQPWLVLQSNQRPVFDSLQYLSWLQALEQSMAQGTEAQQQRLLERYDQENALPGFLTDLDKAHQWLFVLNRLPDAVQRRQQLANELLKLKFDPRVLHIWLQDQLQQDNIECQHFTQRLNDLAQRYPGQPSIALAQWHQLVADQQYEAARIILDNWQQHPEFSYLRLKEALANQPRLLADLDIIYEHLKR